MDNGIMDNGLHRREPLSPNGLSEGSVLNGTKWKAVGTDTMHHQGVNKWT
jgi:hypothetical protein